MNSLSSAKWRSSAGSVREIDLTAILANFITQRKKGLLSLVTFTPPSTSLTIIEPQLKDSN